MDKNDRQLPAVNQYFAASTSRDNFFDDLSPAAGENSALMRSTIDINSSASEDLFQNSTKFSPSAILEQSLKSEEQSTGDSSSSNTKSKEEPVICRVFSTNEMVNANQADGSARDFFDMLNSPTSQAVPSFGNVKPNLRIDYNLAVEPNCISSDYMQDNLIKKVDNDEPFFGTKGCNEYDRSRDAWIPSERTRLALEQASSVPGSIPTDPQLLTMPGVIPDEDLVDTVQQVVTHFLGEAEANQRRILTMKDVTQDERGLRELIKAECFKAAVNLTGVLLKMYGQGAGRAGHASKHTVHSIQLWFTRIALLVKLQSYSLAEAEASVWWDCDRPDLYYQFYPELYGGRLGTLVPFQFRLLLAVLPSFSESSERHQEALDRLHSVLAVVRKIISNLDSGKSEGGDLELSAEERASSKNLWKQREARVLHSVVNVALQMKDYWLAVDVLQLLIKNENQPSQKRALSSALGRVLLQLGDVISADKCFQTARSLKQTQTGTLASHTADLQELVDRGLMAVAQHAFQDAYDAFQKASLLEPFNLMVQNNMAVCQLYLGNLKTALSILCASVHSHTNSALQENLLLNVCTLFELESSQSKENKLALLRLVNKYKGDAFSLPCLKLKM